MQGTPSNLANESSILATTKPLASGDLPTTTAQHRYTAYFHFSFYSHIPYHHQPPHDTTYFHDTGTNLGCHVLHNYFLVSTLFSYSLLLCQSSRRRPALKGNAADKEGGRRRRHFEE